MTDQPQPSPQTIIRIQSQEIERLNGNRLYLMALLEDTKAEALAEIAKRDEEIASLKAPEAGE
jgi:hypothetical protein